LSKLQDYINNLYPDTTSQPIKLGLDRVSRVKSLVKIEPNFPIIIVGGTNGKGSVCSFLETIYSKAGYSVGCFTSPHLFKFNERIKINLEQVDDETILESLNIINTKKKSIELTYFEITTLASMNIFIQKKIDIAILEVGLGGRLDAVNIFDPDLSIITSIGLDHQEYLGDTIEEIAHEKSGICRPNKHTVLNFENIPKSMIMELNKLKVPLSILNDDYSYKFESERYNYVSDNISMNNLPKPHLNGNSQLINLAGCLRATNLLQNILPITLDSIKKGIRDTRIKGRLQVLSNKPYIVADVAHNADAAINLYNFISTSKRSGKVYAVFAILEDKDIEKVLMPFVGIVDEWFVSEVNNPRAQKIDVIIDRLKKYNQEVVINQFDNLTQAYNNVCKKCSLNDNIIIYGSFFTVSETLNGVTI
jgi:dihydrofolate synthase/folylpolyglutamate synthase|tara:strand:- start:4140 stop:5399 length:1260 start_codon:yes stop_codon:yes gene_type:complete